MTKKKIDEVVEIIETFLSKKTQLQRTLKVIATMSRMTSNENELEFEKGEIFLIIKDQGHWLQVQSEKTGEIGNIPENFTCSVDSLEAMPWYFNQNRERAEADLKADGRRGSTGSSRYLRPEVNRIKEMEHL